MSAAACAGCGRPARPLMAALMLAPLALGGLGIVALAATRGMPHGGLILAAVTLAFVAFTAALVHFGLRVWRGKACPQCGRDVEPRG